MARTNLPAQTPQVPRESFVAFDLLYRHVSQLNLDLKVLEGNTLSAHKERANTTTLVLDSDFQFSLSPFQRKRFSALLFCTGNVKMRFVGPAAPFGMLIERKLNDGTVTHALDVAYSTTDILIPNIGILEINGMIYNDVNPGVFGITWAQITSDPLPSGFYSGSVFRNSHVV